MSTSPRIVPMKGVPMAPVAQPLQLTYHQGKLLTAVEVYTIFWGTGWQQAPQNGLIQQLNDFFDFILTSSLMDLLGEYSVAGQIIGYGRRVGTNTITTSDPGTANPDGSRVVTDTQIQQAIQDWINNHTIPQPNNNTLFFVYLPPKVTSQSGSDSSCSSYCGYHSAINNNIFYAVMPYISCGGCSSGQNLPFDSLTEVSSHELCEAITDPDPTSGWNDDNLSDGEIGDLCNFQAAQLGGYNVQKQWSNQANACLLEPPHGQDVLTQFSSPIVGVGGYYVNGENSQHVIVGTSDGTLTEVYWKSAQGVHQDVLTHFSSPIVAVAGYYAADDGAQHAIVGTSDGTLTEVYWKSAQGIHQDVLTHFSSPIVAIAGYYAADDDTQHVIVGTRDGNLTEVYWKPAQGVHQDVLTQFGSSIVAVGGYYAADDDTQHAIVGTSDGTLTEVYWKPAQGVHRDVLTTFASEAITGVAGYYAPKDDTQHVIVGGIDGSITDVHWKPAQGVHRRVLTQLNSGIVGVAGYYSIDDNRRHAIAGSKDGTLTEVFW